MESLGNLVLVILGGVATAYGVIKTWQEARAASHSSARSDLQAAADEWRELKEEYATRLAAVETRASDMEKRLDASATREKLRDQHIEALERHITDGLPPPPPARPY